MKTLAAYFLIRLRHKAADWCGPLGFHTTMVGATDSQGTGYAVSKLYTGTQPGASMLWCLADWCQLTDVMPTAEWLPRAENTWADQLTRDDISGFSPGKRQFPDPAWLADVQKTRALMTGLAMGVDPAGLQPISTF